MSADASLRARATLGVAWSAAHLWGAHAVQVGIMLVLARLLEPRDFGLFAMAQVVLVLVQSVIDQGIPEALVQGDRNEPADWSTGLLAVLTGAAIGACVLAAGAPLLSGLFREPALTPLLRWLAPAVFLVGVHAVFYARARSNLMFGGHARAGIAGALSNFAAAVAVAIAGGGVWALVAGAYAGQLVETLLLVGSTGLIPWAGFDAARYRRLFRYGRHVILGGLVTFLERRTDDYFVGLFLGASILGLYTVAYRFLELATTVFLRAVERVAFPVLAKLQQKPALVADAVRTSFRFTSLVSFPAFAGLVVVAPDLVVTLLGETWAGAAGPLRILAIGGFALTATVALPSALRALGKPHWTVMIGGVKGIIVAGLFSLAARENVEAVALVFTASAFLAFPAFFLAAARVIPLSARDYAGEAARPLAATVLMFVGLSMAAPLLGAHSSAIRLLVMVALGVTLYGLGVTLLARRHLAELWERVRVLRG